MSTNRFYGLCRWLRRDQGLSLRLLHAFQPFRQWQLAHDGLLPQLLWNGRLGDRHWNTAIEDTRLLSLSILLLALGNGDVICSVHRGGTPMRAKVGSLVPWPSGRRWWGGQLLSS